MVSANHEAIHQVFRQDPGIFNRMFRRLGQDFPEAVSVEHLPTDLTGLQFDRALSVATAAELFV